MFPCSDSFTEVKQCHSGAITVTYHISLLKRR